MEIYLIRHTTPDIEKNICYGQSDIGVHSSFFEEAKKIKERLPDNIQKIYSSPLIRCKKLAEYLFPAQQIEYLNELAEINCGDWELKNWNEIDPLKLNEWMADFVNVPYPGGESFIQFNKRVIDLFSRICVTFPSIVLITHAGVIRSILSFITKTPLSMAFSQFKPGYGSMIAIKKRK